METAQEPMILLVEDSEDDAFFFEREFRKSTVGGRVHHVLNGRAAVEFLTKSAHAHSLPKAVFLDLKMPVMNGFEVLAWLQNQPYGRHFPTFVLSGSEHQADKDRARELGAADYLVKPIRQNDLDRVVDAKGRH